MLFRWYSETKAVHVTAVAINYILFVLRGVWMLYRPDRLRMRWIRIVPHMNDTVLLASGIVLAMAIRQYPGASPWLTAKLAGLLVYILLGMGAFRFARKRRTCAAFWIGAQAAFFYIVAVAITKHLFPL